MNGTAWSFTPGTELAAGHHSLSAVVENTASQSAGSSSAAFGLDTQHLQLTAVSDHAGLLQGNLLSFDPVTGLFSVGSAMMTDDAQPTFSGLVDLQAGQKLMAFDNTGAGVDISSSVSAGSFSYTPSGWGVGTTHVERFEVQDASGHTLLSTSASVSLAARETLLDALPSTASAESVLTLSGGAQVLDLTLVSPSSHAGIDRIDLGGSALAHNSLVLATADVLQADVDARTAATGWASLQPQGLHQMVIDGGAGSSVDMTDGTWNAMGSINHNGQSYVVYQNGLAQLLIDSDITRQGAVI